MAGLERLHAKGCAPLSTDCSATAFVHCWQGVYVLMSGLDYERLVLSAGPLGIMQASVPRLAAAGHVCPPCHVTALPCCPAASCPPAVVLSRVSSCMPSEEVSFASLMCAGLP